MIVSNRVEGVPPIFGAPMWVQWLEMPCPVCAVEVTLYKMREAGNEYGSFHYSCRNGHSASYTRAMDPAESQATGRHA